MTDDYRERVIVERNELADKVTKLRAFFDAQVFRTLSASEQARLRRQYGHMNAYLGVLLERIEAWD